MAEPRPKRVRRSLTNEQINEQLFQLNEDSSDDISFSSDDGSIYQPAEGSGEENLNISSSDDEDASECLHILHV